CMPWAGHTSSEGYPCQGNLLSGPQVIDAMAKVFEATQGQLPERMLAALDAGDDAGGDSRGEQAAALYIAKEGGSYGGHLDRFIDLRVDDHERPLIQLRRLLELHRLTFGSGGRPTLMRPSGNTAREIQRILKNLGYYSEELTGDYDEATQAAFQTFCNVENLEERLAEAHRSRGRDWIDREILDHMRREYGSN
ncbi:MAG: DUF1028 domain-containing protein, partial [Gemmatimonadetes bacterium]|nr:DUF1028 domain-containing protein [Gemmatimonadota bacterium]